MFPLESRTEGPYYACILQVPAEVVIHHLYDDTDLVSPFYLYYVFVRNRAFGGEIYVSQVLASFGKKLPEEVGMFFFSRYAA